MKKILIVLLSLFLFACSKPSEEEEFKESEKTYINTGFVAAVAFDKVERTICLGVLQNDESIVAADVATIKKDDVLSFRSSNEFILVEDAPGDIELDENCVYVERGYADSPREDVEIGVIAYKIDAELKDEK
ncbi:MAG: hypothetical protein HQM13_05380 [SAR324 cluster bacterium]|nr:hypothetical protein [SAR324 cluster bacterium]